MWRADRNEILQNVGATPVAIERTKGPEVVDMQIVGSIAVDTLPPVAHDGAGSLHDPISAVIDLPALIYRNAVAGLRTKLSRPGSIVGEGVRADWAVGFDRPFAEIPFRFPALRRTENCGAPIRSIEFDPTVSTILGLVFRWVSGPPLYVLVRAGARAVWTCLAFLSSEGCSALCAVGGYGLSRPAAGRRAEPCRAIRSLREGFPTMFTGCIDHRHATNLTTRGARA
jgi:hypothetical protein